MKAQLNQQKTPTMKPKAESKEGGSDKTKSNYPKSFPTNEGPNILPLRAGVPVDHHLSFIDQARNYSLLTSRDLGSNQTDNNFQSTTSTGSTDNRTSRGINHGKERDSGAGLVSIDGKENSVVPTTTATTASSSSTSSTSSSSSSSSAAAASASSEVAAAGAPSGRVSNAVRLREQRWEMMLALLVEQEKDWGSMNIPLSHKISGDDGSEIRLGLWLGTQRQAYRKGKLKEDKLNKLQAFVDAGRLEWGQEKAAADDKQWDYMFSLLLEFGEHYGHCNVPERYCHPVKEEVKNTPAENARFKKLREAAAAAAASNANAAVAEGQSKFGGGVIYEKAVAAIEEEQGEGEDVDEEEEEGEEEESGPEGKKRKRAQNIGSDQPIELAVEGGKAKLGRWLHRQRNQAKRKGLRPDRMEKLQSLCQEGKLNDLFTTVDKQWRSCYDALLRFSRTSSVGEQQFLAENWISEIDTNEARDVLSAAVSAAAGSTSTSSASSSSSSSSSSPVDSGHLPLSNHCHLKRERVLQQPDQEQEQEQHTRTNTAARAMSDEDSRVAHPTILGDPPPHRVSASSAPMTGSSQCPHPPHQPNPPPYQHKYRDLAGRKRPAQVEVPSRNSLACTSTATTATTTVPPSLSFPLSRSLHHSLHHSLPPVLPSSSPIPSSPS